MDHLRARIEKRNVYGKTTTYPANIVALSFAKIAGTSTLTPETIQHMLSLGVQFETDVYGSVLHLDSAELSQGRWVTTAQGGTT